MSRLQTARRLGRAVVALRGAACAAALGALLSAAMVAASSPVFAAAGPAPSADAGSRGAAKAQACNACHGTPERAPLAGMPALAGQQGEFLVMQMFLFREGLREVPQMAGLFKGLTDQDLNDLAAYYERQAPPRGSTRPDAKLYALGARLSTAMGCGSCHHQDYRGQRQVPRLTYLQEDYLAATMKAYRDNKRVGVDTNMNGILYRMPDSDIRALAHYYAHYLAHQADRK